ncbi:Nuclear hormone receptor [Aphelenchoides avenae]|nr:Nuclear hormone receptor [Aphelenchus avenae]
MRIIQPTLPPLLAFGYDSRQCFAPISLSKHSPYWHSPVVMQLLKLRAQHDISLVELQEALGVLGFQVSLTVLDEKLKDLEIHAERLRISSSKEQTNTKRSKSPSTRLERAMHNEQEKKRRVNICEYLNRLKLALPSRVDAPFDTTFSILKRSCHYLRCLKTHREQLTRRRSLMLIERARLIDEHEQLKRQLQVKRHAYEMSESLGSDLASPASLTPTEGRWSKLTSVTKKPTDDACSQFCTTLQKAESSQLAASEEENETQPSSSPPKDNLQLNVNARKCEITGGLAAGRRLQAFVVMMDAELGYPIERLVITNDDVDSAPSSHSRTRSSTSHESLNASEQEHPTSRNRPDAVVRLEPDLPQVTPEAHLLRQIGQSDDLEEEHLLNLLTYYESKLHKLRESGFTAPSDARFSPFNKNLRSLLEMPKYLDLLIPGTTIYNEARKQEAILAPPNLPRLSAWLSGDIFLSVEWAKALPVVERLGLLDKERLLLATGLVSTMMTQCFHSYVRRSITVVMPDYEMPMKVRHFPRLENEIFCRPLETLHRVRPTAVEYVLLKAIVCCQPDAPGLSSSAQSALAEERERYARILLRHCQEEIGERNSAGRFAELLEVAETYIAFAQRRREHFALTAVVFKMSATDEAWAEVLRIVKEHKEKPNELSDREPLVQGIKRLFSRNLSSAIENNAAQVLWDAQKKLLDFIKANLKVATRDGDQEMIELGKANYANALRACYGEWAELASLVEGSCVDWIEFFPLTDHGPCQKLMQCPLDDPKRQFALVLFLRLGDICRYMADYSLCRNLYNAAFAMDPRNGQCWNQMAVLDAIQPQSKEHSFRVVYMYCRAAYATIPFKPAFANIDYILGERKPTRSITKEHDFEDVFLHVLADIVQNSCTQEKLDELNSAFFDVNVAERITAETLLQVFVVTAAVVDKYGDNGSHAELTELVNNIYEFFVSRIVDTWDDEILCVYQAFLSWMLAAGIAELGPDSRVSPFVERLIEHLEEDESDRELPRHL